MNTPSEAVSFTPGEWAVEYNTHYDRFQLRSLKTGSFGHFCGWSADGVTTEDEDKANAARIVLCVNSHDALLDACRAFVECSKDWVVLTDSEREMVLLAQDAIRKAAP